MEFLPKEPWGNIWSGERPLDTEGNWKDLTPANQKASQEVGDRAHNQLPPTALKKHWLAWSFWDPLEKAQTYLQQSVCETKC